MSKPIEWKSVKRKVSELKPYHKNPRDITEQGLSELNRSISKFGLAEPIVISTENIIIGGHARWQTLKQLNVKECDCYLPNRKLTAKEIDELNIRLNKNIAGNWNFDILANEFEVDDLLDWGFTKKDLQIEDDNQKDLSDKLTSVFEIVISCVNEKEQEKIYNTLKKEGYECRVLTL